MYANRALCTSKMIKHFVVWAILWILLSAYGHGAVALDLRLDGEFIQGGLIQGVTTVGTVVYFDGRRVRVSDTGIFIVGLGRLAPSEAILELHYPTGKIHVERLFIKSRRYHTQRIDGLSGEKVIPPKNVLERIASESARVSLVRQRDDDRTDFLTGFIWPVLGKITGVYGSQRILNGEQRSPHYGIDIAVPVGTQVRAPADGIVSLIADDLYFSGGTLIVDHGHGLSSTFLHLSKITVGLGQRILRGDVIAEVGATGRTTGPHLDWRMNWFEVRIDPELAIKSGEWEMQ